MKSSSQFKFAETSYLNGLLDEITTLGTQRYPTAFDGVKAISADTIDLYVTRNHEAFLRAVRRSVSRRIRIRLIITPRSYGYLEALTLRIAGKEKALMARGVPLQTWGPNPFSDTVQVTLAKSSRAAAVASMSAARQILDGWFGSTSITITPTRDALPVTIDLRDNDASPVKAGDGVSFSQPGGGGLCTTGFATTANGGAHNTFILAAGHCGTGPVTITYNGLSIGSEYRQYLQPLDGSGLDFETIKASVSTGPDVWYGPSQSNSSYIVEAYTTPAYGSSMTLDGDYAAYSGGQITDTTVALVNGCVNSTDSFYGTYTTCDVGEATNNAGSGPQACVHGDSGGPAYVRRTPPNVDAAGTLVAAADNGHECWFQEIWKELSYANLTLNTN